MPSSSSLSSLKGGRSVRIILLNQEQLFISVETKAKVQDVFGQVCEHLNLREREYFGLAKVNNDDEFQFLELNTKLHKLCPKQPKSWKSQKSDERPCMTFYFRVQFYVEHVSLLKERITRQLYYQQLKYNLLNYSQEVSEEKCFLLAAYSLQADIGNYVQEKHNLHYFDPREFFPAWVIEKRGSGYLRENMPTVHRDFHNMPKQQASMMYAKELSRAPLPHNMHMYRVQRSKQEEPGAVFLAIGPQGVHIYQEDFKFRTLLSSFPWCDIGRLHFEKKKFEIQPSGHGEARKFRYYTGSEERGKYLLALCQNSHQFQLAMAPKLAEQKQYEAEDRRYRECYIYSDNSFGSGSVGRWSAGKLSIGREMRGRTSTSSSLTTSGIASERLQTSIDESEESKEILINSPPSTKENVNSSNSLSPSTSLNVLASTNTQQSSAYSLANESVKLSLPLKPADTHIKKMTFAPTQTVNSKAVVLNNITAQNGPLPLNHHIPIPNVTNKHFHHVPNTNLSLSGVRHNLENSANGQFSVMRAPFVPPNNISQCQSSQLATSVTQVNNMFAQPQFTQPLLQAHSTQQLQPDHTYVNLENVTPTVYSHTSRASASGTNLSNSLHSLSSPIVTGPFTSTPYQSPPDHTVHRAVIGPSNSTVHTENVIINRPNRSYSQLLTQTKGISPPQRAVSNADAYISKRPNRVTCPLHGVCSDLYKEIKAKSQRKDTPLLQALYHDTFLLRKENCTCGTVCTETEDALPLRRFSYSQPSCSASTPDLVNQPGTVVRPVSWHEPTLQLFGHNINIDNIQSQDNSQRLVHNDLQYSITQQQSDQQQQNTIDNTQLYLQHLNIDQSLSFLPNSQLDAHFHTVKNSAHHQSMNSLEYPTMLTYQSPGEVLSTHNSSVHPPPYLYRNHKLSGSQSVDNLLQPPVYTYGLVN